MQTWCVAVDVVQLLKQLEYQPSSSPILANLAALIDLIRKPRINHQVLELYSGVGILIPSMVARTMQSPFNHIDGIWNIIKIRTIRIPSLGHITTQLKTMHPRAVTWRQKRAVEIFMAVLKSIRQTALSWNSSPVHSRRHKRRTDD